MAYEVSKTIQNDIAKLLTTNMKAIKSVLPKHLTPERAARIAFTAIVKNQKLATCSPLSLLNAVLEASMLGLEIGGPLGFAHLVPFKGTATLIIDYKGYMDLAHRSDRLNNFSFHPVWEKDYFKYTYGTNPFIEHVPCEEDDPGPLKYAYAIAKFKNGGMDFEVVNKRIAMKAKSRSAAKDKADSPWNTDDEWAMWCKTAVRRLAKRVPLSPELQRAAILDERAEAGIDQGIDHIIDVDFTAETTGEKKTASELTEQLKAKGKKPDPTPITCPDGEVTNTAECEKCLKRSGCPSWD